ncbi:hypothetical protein RHMOL_Rhmol10G0274400 [Rhododendron molle]|nr:hypothetical protein RHMOL_Rhmol10G0274400 [Rhododendron molle]
MVNLSITMRLPKDIIESDSESIVRNCLATIAPPSDIGILVQDSKILRDSFMVCVFKFVKRDCNRAAQYCARWFFPVVRPACGQPRSLPSRSSSLFDV